MAEIWRTRRDGRKFRIEQMGNCKNFINSREYAEQLIPIWKRHGFNHAVVSCEQDLQHIDAAVDLGSNSSVSVEAVQYVGNIIIGELAVDEQSVPNAVAELKEIEMPVEVRVASNELKPNEESTDNLSKALIANWNRPKFNPIQVTEIHSHPELEGREWGTNHIHFESVPIKRAYAHSLLDKVLKIMVKYH